MSAFSEYKALMLYALVRSIQTLQELLNNSCIFELAVHVAKAFFKFCDTDMPPMTNFAMVGHSLGGAVVQHVVSSLDFRPTIEACNGGTRVQLARIRSIPMECLGLN